MDCVRCGHRLPPDQAARGRTWHKETPCPLCLDEWCSHPHHLEARDPKYKGKSIGEVYEMLGGKK